MNQWIGRIAVFLAASLVVCGCVSKYATPLAVRTPATCGNVKLYGTDNVPFDYEEVAFLSQTYDQIYNPDNALRDFAALAQGMGADAILNFRMESEWIANVCLGFSTGPTRDFKLSGVAVKIKRP